MNKHMVQKIKFVSGLNFIAVSMKKIVRVTFGRSASEILAKWQGSNCSRKGTSRENQFAKALIDAVRNDDVDRNGTRQAAVTVTGKTTVTTAVDPVVGHRGLVAIEGRNCTMTM